MSLNMLEPQLTASVSLEAWDRQSCTKGCIVDWKQSNIHLSTQSRVMGHLLQVASASSEPSAHSGSPSQRQRAGTHWPFLQVKSVVAQVFFAMEDNVTLEAAQQHSSVIFKLSTHFACKMMWSFVFSEQEDLFDSLELILKRKSGWTGQSMEWKLQGCWSSSGASTVCRSRATTGYVTNDQDHSHPADDEVFFYKHHNMRVCKTHFRFLKFLFTFPHKGKHHYYESIKAKVRKRD